MSRPCAIAHQLRQMAYHQTGREVTMKIMISTAIVRRIRGSYKLMLFRIAKQTRRVCAVGKRIQVNIRRSAPKQAQYRYPAQSVMEPKKGRGLPSKPHVGVETVRTNCEASRGAWWVQSLMSMQISEMTDYIEGSLTIAPSTIRYEVCTLHFSEFKPYRSKRWKELQWFQGFFVGALQGSPSLLGLIRLIGCIYDVPLDTKMKTVVCMKRVWGVLL